MNVKQLRAVCQGKKIQKKEVPFFYKIHRIWSIYVTLVFIQLGVKPNGVTVLGLFCGAVSLFLLAVPRTEYFLAGVAVYYFSFLLDKCDGEVARYINKHSAKGVYLDELYHFIVNPGLFIAVGVHVFFLTKNPYFLLLGFATDLLYVLIRVERKLYFFIYCKSENFRNKTPVTITSKLHKILKCKLFAVPGCATYTDIIIYTLICAVFFDLKYFLYCFFTLYIYILFRHIVLNIYGELENNLSSLKLK
jgi:phosphatidylglycerophosphate synthase